MGAVFSRKKKAEPTTLEKLEQIEGKIKSFEEHIQLDRRREKKIWATILFTTGFLYVSVAGFLHLFVLERKTVLDYIKIGLIWLAPVVIIYFILQRFIPWYFSRGIQEYREKLKKLREEKKKILDNVRENEPYNKAKTILEKYEGPQTEPPKQKNIPQPRPSLPPYQKMPVTPFPSFPPGTPGAPGPLGPPSSNNRVSEFSNSSRAGPSQFPVGRPPQMRERGAFDRVLDYIVKDGPENRMALICRACGAHNGLCLLDEYDFTGFRCFECRLPNPPRKPRPSLPNIAFPQDSRSRSVSNTNSVGGAPSIEEVSGSGSESGSGSGSGSETEPETDAVHTATVRQPVAVTVQDTTAPVQSIQNVQNVQTVSAIAENLEESDTGSESDDEMEESVVVSHDATDGTR